MVTKDLQTQRLHQALKEVTDYREFLRVYVEYKAMSLAALARATGHGRGFPSDVLKGKRRLSLKSYVAFENALRLPTLGKKLFRFLVASEERDLFPDLHPVEIGQGLEHARKTPWQTARRNVHEIESLNARALFEDSTAMAVYAACGEPGKGSSFEDILLRTRLPRDEAQTYVERLQAAGFVEKSNESYVPRDLHLFVQTSDQSVLLTNSFRRAAQSASARVSAIHGKSDQEMFFCSNFCVSESSLPELKAALRETILKFVDSSIHPSGDRIVKLVTALHL